MLLRQRPHAGTLIKTVAIVGGTHGNERAGIHLIKLFDKNPELVSRPSFNTTCLISNVDAVKADTRYVSEDLNRCFDTKYLDLAKRTMERHSEMRRCLEVNSILGPKEAPKTDFVVDIHNTTANTGILLCFHKTDTFASQVSAYLKLFHPEIVTVFWAQADPPFLPSVGKSGMTMEIGPVAHSTINSKIFHKTKELISLTLDYVELHNKLALDPDTIDVEKLVVNMKVAERVAEIDYPRDKDGFLSAFIHSSLQGISELKDGSTVKQGSPIFISALGETIHLDLFQIHKNNPDVDPEEQYFPMFVNEAAYYEKGVAFILTRLKDYKITTLRKSSISSKV